MPRMLYSLTDRIVDLVTSQAAKTAPMVIFVLVQCVLRICILRPLIIFCCMVPQAGKPISIPRRCISVWGHGAGNTLTTWTSAHWLHRVIFRVRMRDGNCLCL